MKLLTIERLVLLTASRVQVQGLRREPGVRQQGGGALIEHEDVVLAQRFARLPFPRVERVRQEVVLLQKDVAGIHLAGRSVWRLLRSQDVILKDRQMTHAINVAAATCDKKTEQDERAKSRTC